MKAGLKPSTTEPAVMQSMIDIEKAVVDSGLEQSLIELVKTQASQING